ncbi:16663_t:CDS:2, partial [Acaulospora colombiana]
YRSHSTTTLGYLEQALKVFHSLKNVFIKNQARRGKNGVIRHFSIPKLAGLHAYLYHIPRMGTAVQFSTEITENCHQTMAKMAYRATNRKDFFVQMCAYLNRDAIFSLMEDLSNWAAGSGVRELAIHGVAGSLSNSFVERMAAAAKRQEQLEIRRQSRARNAHVWLTVKPDQQNILYDSIAQFYGLHGHRIALTQLLDQYSTRDFPVDLATLHCDVWFRFRIQRPTVQDEDELADTRTVQAIPPPVQKNRHGLCNCVLIKDDPNAEDTGVKGADNSCLHHTHCTTHLWFTTIASRRYQPVPKQISICTKLSTSMIKINVALERLCLSVQSAGWCSLFHRLDDA